MKISLLFPILFAGHLLFSQSQVFKITDFGAVGDGATLCTSAIQNAVDSANATGGGTVLFPPGAYLSGSFWLKSKVTLHLEKGATLLGSTNWNDYQKHHYWHSLILSNGQNDIGVVGAGTIDGQGRPLSKEIIRRWLAGDFPEVPGWDPSKLEKNRPHERLRPHLINFLNCKNIRIEGITLKDASCWVQTYEKCEDILIQKIRVESRAYWNNDGIDLVDCRRALVRDCYIDSDDDGICLKSSYADWACEDITIENCRVRSSASALKFGTASTGGFKRIRVRGLDIWDTFRSAIALEIVDGGTMEDIEISDIRAKKTGNAIFMRLGHRTTRRPVGTFKNVRIRDVRVEIPKGKPDAGFEMEGPVPLDVQNLAPSSIVGLPTHPIRDITIENLEIIFGGGGDPKVANAHRDSLDKVPERPSEYPEFSMFGELPAWAFFVRHASGVVFKNCRFVLAEADYRPAFVFDDVDGIVMRKVRTSGAADGGKWVERNVRQAVFKKARRR